jgi:hypothetical protein
LSPVPINIYFCFHNSVSLVWPIFNIFPLNSLPTWYFLLLYESFKHRSSLIVSGVCTYEKSLLEKEIFKPKNRILKGWVLEMIVYCKLLHGKADWRWVRLSEIGRRNRSSIPTFVLYNNWLILFCPDTCE